MQKFQEWGKYTNFLKYADLLHLLHLEKEQMIEF